MGKTTVAGVFARLGVAVVDTDEIARELTAPGQSCLAAIVEAFGTGILRSSGDLDRGQLAELVFGSSDARKQLEAIMHPPIRKAWESRVAGWEREGRAAGMVVIPLLHETGVAERFCKVICVACGFRSQRERLRAKGWSEEQGERRRKAQWPIEEKTKKSDFVVWSEGSLSLLERQVEMIMEKRCGIAPG